MHTFTGPVTFVVLLDVSNARAAGGFNDMTIEVADFLGGLFRLWLCITHGYGQDGDCGQDCPCGQEGELLFWEGSVYKPFMSLRNMVTSSLVVSMSVLWEKTVSNASADSFV